MHRKTNIFHLYVRSYCMYGLWTPIPEFSTARRCLYATQHIVARHVRAQNSISLDQWSTLIVSRDTAAVTTACRTKHSKGSTHIHECWRFTVALPHHCRTVAQLRQCCHATLCHPMLCYPTAVELRIEFNWYAVPSYLYCAPLLYGVWSTPLAETCKLWSLQMNARGGLDRAVHGTNMEMVSSASNYYIYCYHHFSFLPSWGACVHNSVCPCTVYRCITLWLQLIIASLALLSIE